MSERINIDAVNLKEQGAEGKDCWTQEREREREREVSAGSS
jgi:hypothetical protein